MDERIEEALTNDIPHLKKDVAVIRTTLGHHGKLLYIIMGSLVTGAVAIVITNLVV